jgi:uncharacterized protein
LKKILLLSDTHGFLDDRVLKYAEDRDEIWHAGDIGDLSVGDKLASLKPFRAVYGNIDGQTARRTYPKDLFFNCEDVKVWITHIGGYPDHYPATIKQQLISTPVDLFICGHSHILKVIYDKKLNLLHMNPGACGNSGFHKVKTMLRFTIEGKNIKDLDVVEWKRNYEM